MIAVIEYWDTYSRREGLWLFEDRLVQTFYVADALERPDGAAIKHVVTKTGAATTATLPKAWASWASFCEEEGIDPEVSDALET